MHLQAILAVVLCAIRSIAGSDDRSISMELFSDLEELSRIGDISYCTLMFTSGISKPFTCWSRCPDFPRFELIKDWRTGLSWRSDSGGYLALDHERSRIIVAFRGTINLAGMVADLRLTPQEYTPFPGAEDQATGQTSGGEYVADVPECPDCSVHTGFYRAWNNTRPHIIEAVKEQMANYPNYELHLVGHSLGAAVGAFAALDFNARGWEPTITTFGEPRIGNAAMNGHIDEVFGLDNDPDQRALRWRRVTHTNDPIPLLPPTEWGYAMHSGEIYISKPSLSPSVKDLKHCKGAFDQNCIARLDPTYPKKLGISMLDKRGLLGTLREDVPELIMSIVKWDLPHRYRVWQVLIAHRDYFWRLGLCVPGGDPTGGGGKFPELKKWRAENGVRMNPGRMAEAVEDVVDHVKEEL